MWIQSAWDISKYHPICGGYLWVNPTSGLLAYYNTQTSKYTIAQNLPTLTATGGISATFYLLPCRKWSGSFIFISDPDLSNAQYALWNGNISGLIGGANTSADYWWSMTSGTYVGTAAKQGRAGNDITMAWTSDYGQWECSQQAGSYASKGQASGTQGFGMRILTCSPIPQLTESITQVNNKPTFTATGWKLSYSGTQWILAGPHSEVTWTCSTLLGSYSRQTALTSDQITALGSPYTQASITVSVSSWTMTNATTAIYTAEASHFLTGWT